MKLEPEIKLKIRKLRPGTSAMTKIDVMIGFVDFSRFACFCMSDFDKT